MALRRAVVFVAPGLCEQVGTGDEAVRIRRRIIVPTLSLVEGRACVLQIWIDFIPVIEIGPGEIGSKVGVTLIWSPIAYG